MQSVTAALLLLILPSCLTAEVSMIHENSAMEGKDQHDNDIENRFQNHYFRDDEDEEDILLEPPHQQYLRRAKHDEVPKKIVLHFATICYDGLMEYS
eukprot:13132580-Ditylum_brightwellii.AAC.1